MSVSILLYCKPYTLYLNNSCGLTQQDANLVQKVQFAVHMILEFLTIKWYIIIVFFDKNVYG